MDTFDWKQYLTNYKDLILYRVNTKEKAWAHYNMYGKKENRTDKNLNATKAPTVVEMKNECPVKSSNSSIVVDKKNCDCKSKESLKIVPASKVLHLLPEPKVLEIPNLVPQTPKPQPVPEVVPKPEVVLEVVQEPEVVPEPKLEQVLEVVQEPEVVPEVVPKPEVVLEVVQEPEVVPEPKLEQVLEVVQEPEVVPEPKLEQVLEVVPEPVPEQEQEHVLEPLPEDSTEKIKDVELVIDKQPKRKYNKKRNN
jgi:hypothetical protein